MSARCPSVDLPPASFGADGLRPLVNASIHKIPSSETMDTDEEDLVFDSVEEEVSHYREKYRRISDMLEETRAEMEDFQASTRDLEDELDRELQNTEKTQRDFRDRIQRLEVEKEEWKNKHVNLQKLHSSTTTNMQREMDNLRSERDRTLVALRDLEMGNDELERNERVAVSSLLDLESRYNRAIEEKILLEQEVIHRQELEEESQRLKDELRDANNEIAILRDQISRAVPTPPSSISVHMSPLQEAVRDRTLPEIPPFVSSPPSFRPMSPDYAPTPPPKPQITTPSRNLRLPRSATASSIPTLSPAIKRQSTIANSPSGISQLSRSTTVRNLAGASITPGSPARALRKSDINPNQTKTRGVTMLHALGELRARMKATENKIPKAGKRNVSNSLAVPTTRNVSAAAPPASILHSRVTALSESRTDDLKTPPTYTGDLSGTAMLSPWEVVGHPPDTPTFDTPTDRPNGIRRDDPTSPLEPNFRAVSTTSTLSRGLPSRPGIPSPLASTNLTRSTMRPPLRPGLSRPISRHDDPNASRPLSPTMIPVLSRAPTRALSPTNPGTPSQRPGSRSTQRILGRGPPPSSHIFPNTTHQPLALSVSSSTPNGLRRSTRRSSLGVSERGLPSTGIPAPVSRGGTTPTRPTSIATSLAYPPPVPRIPSAHLKESARKNGALGISTRERPKSAVHKENGWKT